MRTPEFVSLFAGAGGLDLGLERAGWSCRYASDIDPDAIETLARNRHGAQAGADTAFAESCIEVADARRLTGPEILARAGAARVGDIPLLVGGPPCQSWSSAGHQLGLDDPRGRLFADFIRLAREMDSRWVLFENVRGLLTARGPDGQPGSALALIRRALLRAGYQTTVKLLNAADYGVPQRRVRLLIIGYNRGDEPSFPDPTHARKPRADDAAALPWATLRTCLAAVTDLSEAEVIRPSEKLARQLRAIPPGSGVKSPGKKEATRPGGHWGYKQGAFVADLDLPARTVTAGGQQDWIRDPERGLRRLCPRECAAIQTFPAGWRWSGRVATQYRLIGNAVPPRLAELVGRELLGAMRVGDDRFGETNAPMHAFGSLSPLPSDLEAAIGYTVREELANGASRRNAPEKRKQRTRSLSTRAL